jgi:hypothetical protein
MSYVIYRHRESGLNWCVSYVIYGMSYRRSGLNTDIQTYRHTDIQTYRHTDIGVNLYVIPC